MINSKDINFVVEEASRLGKISSTGNFLQVNFCEICLLSSCGAIPPLFGLCYKWSLDYIKFKGLLKNISNGK